MTMFSIAIIKMHFQAHFTQVVHSTLAKARPPMIAPDVGVNRLTKPLPAEKIITITSGEKPSFAVRGANTGIDTVARPEEDGIKNESGIYTR